MGVESNSQEQESKTYTEIFEENFPFYLSIGMTYEQFWEGDSTLPKFYLKAYEIRLDREREKINYSCWLQGLYDYEVMCSVSPIYQPFAKAGTKPKPYRPEPIPLTNEQIKKNEEEEIHKEVDKFRTFATMFNAKLKDKA